jgi:hypothetical protein
MSHTIEERRDGWTIYVGRIGRFGEYFGQAHRSNRVETIIRTERFSGRGAMRRAYAKLTEIINRAGGRS